MNSRERLLKAINLEEPDKVPVTVHNIKYYLHSLKRQLGKYLDDYHALKLFGFDPALYRGYQIKDNPDWKEKIEVISPTQRRLVVKTPRGTLSETLQKGTVEYRKVPMLKNPKEIECMKYWSPGTPDIESYKKEFNRIGRDGIIRTGLKAGSWGGIRFRGSQQLIRDFFERPSWVKDLFELLTQKAIEYIDKLPTEYLDLVEVAGHIGHFISPQMFKEFILPYDKRLIKALHKKGLRSTYHLDGRFMHLLDHVVEMESDCLETLTPSSHGGDADLPEVKRRIGRKVCLIGGFDQTLLRIGSKKSIRTEVKRLIEEAAPDGGFILMTSDHFFEAPIENVRAMTEAVNKFGRYK